MTRPELTPLQHTILACVGRLSGQLPRSGMAKVLAGTRSARLAAYRSADDFGRLARLDRKTILYQIDILLQQGFLATDAYGNLILPA